MKLNKRIAAAVLFVMRQAQLFKQHAAELLGRVDVKGLARKVVDMRLGLAHALLKLRAVRASADLSFLSN